MKLMVNQEDSLPFAKISNDLPYHHLFFNRKIDVRHGFVLNQQHSQTIPTYFNAFMLNVTKPKGSWDGSLRNKGGFTERFMVELTKASLYRELF